MARLQYCGARMQRVTATGGDHMSADWNRISTTKADWEEPASADGTYSFGLSPFPSNGTRAPARLISLLSATMALGVLACMPEETSTEPSVGAGPEMSVAK